MEDLVLTVPDASEEQGEAHLRRLISPRLVDIQTLVERGANVVEVSALDRRREALQARTAGLTVLRKLFGAGRWNRIGASSRSEGHAGEKRNHDDQPATGMG
jgi:hypothetical protein